VHYVDVELINTVNKSIRNCTRFLMGKGKSPAIEGDIETMSSR